MCPRFAPEKVVECQVWGITGKETRGWLEEKITYVLLSAPSTSTAKAYLAERYLSNL